MNYHPNNTASQYATKLNEVIELDGSWEVGLLEASFPSKADNALSDKCFFTIHFPDKYARVDLPAGYYWNADEILVALNVAQRRKLRIIPGQDLYVMFRLSLRKTRFMVRITNSFVEKVSFSEDLACLLGFEPNKHYTGRPQQTAEHSVNLMGSLNLLYVYCDLLEQVLVGDTKAPLLRIASRPPQTTLHAEHVTFNPVQYVPLQKKCFDSVAIYMMTDTGVPMPFSPGKSLAVLEFRRSAHPYLLI